MKSWSKEYKEKLIPPDRLCEKGEEIRQQGHTIATLNGSFQLLHAGHLHILFEGSQVADKLIVALNSDQSIRQYKGNDRLLIPLEYRMQMMAAFGFVDYVTWFDETDPIRLLLQIKPDIHVNGSEYGENCLEAKTVKSNGGRIHIVPLVPGLSTSTVVQKIKASNALIAHI